MTVKEILERFCRERGIAFWYGNSSNVDLRSPGCYLIFIKTPTVGGDSYRLACVGEKAAEAADEAAELLRRTARINAVRVYRATYGRYVDFLQQYIAPIGVAGVGKFVPSPRLLFFDGGTGGATVYMTSNLDAAPDLQYSADGQTWEDWPYEESGGTFVFDEIELAEGEKVYVRGTNERLSDNAKGKYSIFAGTGSLKAGGTVQSLVFRGGQNNNAIEMARLFYQCTALESVPLLPATTLASDCYASMFYSCTSLASLPDGFTLPATTLASECYRAMFYSCTSLASLPDGFTLPATTLASDCYASMFRSCTSLASLPDGFTLPATTLASSCYYYMFNSCNFKISDDGTTFNFTFGAELPQIVSGVTYSTQKDVATWMGNTTGFNE